jgi:pimeloyl-ACP methyl ester carboxylesterase
VDIGGRRLHLVTDGDGSPAVVIIPATADDVLQWLPIQHRAMASSMVCVYDRAGAGWSDPPPAARRTLDTITDDLHALLDAAQIPPPYILAGHSLGGVIARRYYARFPETVAGMLLIDSSHEDQAKRLRAADWRHGMTYSLRRAATLQARILSARRLAADLGLLRGFNASFAREVPAEHVAAARAISLSARHRRTAVWETLVLAHTWGPPPSLGALPLTVLTAAREPRASRAWWPAWSQMQDELATLSSDGRHIRAAKAGHYIHLDEPDLVVDAISDLVDRCQGLQGRKASQAPGQRR